MCSQNFILLAYLVTNCFIVAGVIRHWNKQSWEENSVEIGTCSQVSTKQKNLMDEDPSLEKKYNTWIVNKALSGHTDSILLLMK
ncbi:MAG: hypothetical protein CM15mV4_1880 [Caudoviricetes sp.]|nr:MAG: hypothetical protein CM15mV4_1880 [Caudoviricetes sp.]